jgi:acetylornithine deacetylase/succinyl-diaminopimelate desuccinylase family protein
MTPAEKKAALKAWFDAHRAEVRQRIVDLTLELVRQRTVNVVPDKMAEHPYLKIRGEEWRVAEIVTRELTRAGVKYESHSRTEGRPNVIGHVGSNRSGQRLLVAAHMDVVPSGPAADWKKLTDPFAAIEKDGMLYGRGVIDNKGPLASALVGALMLKDVLGDAALSGELQIAALSDEEATGPDGVDYGVGFLLENKLIDATFAIIPDIGDHMQKIDIAEKGGGVMRVTARGVQAHGSTPERGVNAIHKMAKLLAKMEAFPFVFEAHPVLGGPTINIGEIFGGAAPNIVPGTCTISVDLRLVPGQTMEQIKAQIEELARPIADDFEVVIANSRVAHAVPPDNPLVKAVQANTQATLGFLPEVMGMGGVTFAKSLNLAGIQAIGWGPGDDNAFHVVDEWVPIDELVDFSLLIGLTALDLVG